MVPAGLILGSCAAANPQYAPAQVLPTGLIVLPPAPAADESGLAVPAEYIAPEPAAPVKNEPKDEKRGNTPPGMDRTGGGPASGAIVDPAGVVTKDPVLRER